MLLQEVLLSNICENKYVKFDKCKRMQKYTFLRIISSFNIYFFMKTSERGRKFCLFYWEWFNIGNKEREVHFVGMAITRVTHKLNERTNLFLVSLQNLN